MYALHTLLGPPVVAPNQYTVTSQIEAKNPKYSWFPGMIFILSRKILTYMCV